MSRVNPNWHISMEGFEKIDDRSPYVMVCNHQSNADIPVLSNLPWEMKWVAKKELFELPFVGHMMKLSGDIAVDRRADGNKVGMVKKVVYYLRNNCSVMFFPEGTRSRDGRVRNFSRGAFELAIREQVQVLPMVLEGTRDCLPRNRWVFEPGVNIRLKVLSPVSVSGYEVKEADRLADDVRKLIIDQLSEWREKERATEGIQIKK